MTLVNMRRDTWIFIGTWISILVPVILYCTFIIQWFSWPFILVFVILAPTSLILLTLVFMTDPGYIPLRQHPIVTETQPNNLSPEQPKLSSVTMVSDAVPEIPLVHLPNESPAPSLPSQYPFISSPPPFLDSKLIQLHGIPITIHYCYTCQSWKPPRTSHCSICARCIYAHDHHCPWTGNCVGYRNYRYFYFFLLLTLILDWYVFGTSLCQLLVLAFTENSLNDSLKSMEIMSSHPVNIILLIYTFIVGWSISFLFGYHCWLVAQNLTTHEQLKDKYLVHENQEYRQRNPFDFGCCINFKSILFDRIDDQRLLLTFWEQEQSECRHV